MGNGGPRAGSDEWPHAGPPVAGRRNAGGPGPNARAAALRRHMPAAPYSAAIAPWTSVTYSLMKFEASAAVSGRLNRYP